MRRLAIVSLLLFTSACQTPEPAVDNRYQRAPENTASTGQAASSPVVQLQNQALAAINEDQYQLAIDYLQRAIKIQPRHQDSAARPLELALSGRYILAQGSIRPLSRDDRSLIRLRC